MKITNNTILITGGTSGIGLGLATMLLKADNTVIICGRRENRLKKIKEEHPQIITKISDVSVDAERKKLFKWVTENYPETNILINNAGVQLRADLTRSLDMKAVRTEMDVNFYGPVHLSSLFADHLSAKENAAIVNISSGLAFTPLASVPVYCASKAALHSFSLSLRYQLRETPVSVFEIIPPAVDTELGHGYRKDKTQSHGGIRIAEFIKGARQALLDDEFEAAVGQAQNLHKKREDLFGLMNKHRS